MPIIEGQRYFPEIEFQPPASSAASKARASVMYGLNEGALRLPQPMHADSAESFRRRLFRGHRKALDAVGRDIGTRLSTSGRRISIVRRLELVPSDPAVKDELVKAYGPQIIDTIIADCQRLPNKEFRIRLGYLGAERRTPLVEARKTTSHEHGHTLGQHIPLPVFEEMKAMTFAALCMGISTGDRSLSAGTDPKDTHDIAANNVAQLLERGIHEGEIVAHLIEQRFGKFGPEDYRRRLGPTAGRLFALRGYLTF